MLFNKQFKKLSDHKNINLIQYIQEYFRLNPETQILIGTDSQNKKRNTLYASAVVLYIPGRGGHVLYDKEEILREKDDRNRLINEVWRSIEIAEYIKEQTNIKATFVDLDLNNDRKYKSNEVLAVAVGLTEAYGYNSRYKNSNNTPLVSYICDNIVK